MYTTNHVTVTLGWHDSIIHKLYLLMENHWGIQSTNFDLVNTYFGIDVGHTYNGINETAQMSDTL